MLRTSATAGPATWVRLSLISGGSFGCSGGLVVDVRVENQLAEEFAGDGVDDADLEVPSRMTQVPS
jgi:hypothetical protein